MLFRSKAVHHHAFTSGGRVDRFIGVGNTSPRDRSSDKWTMLPATRCRREQFGRQPTLQGSQKCHTSIINLLLDTSETGGLALKKATADGLESIVKLLLQEGVEVDKVSVRVGILSLHIC